MDPKALPAGPISVHSQQRQLMRHILTVLFKWKWVIGAVFLAVFLPANLVSYAKPPSFQAASKVLIKQDRAYVAVTAGTSERLMNLPVSRQTINSEVQIIKSKDVLEQVVKALDLAPGAFASVKGTPSTQDAVAALDSAVVVTAVPDSNIMQITVSHRNADTAVKIANKLAEVYQERHASIYSPAGAASFFARQATAYQNELTQAEDQLQKFQGKAGPDPEQQIADTLARQDRTERARRDVEAEIAEVRQQIAVVTEELEKQPARITGQTETVLNRSIEYLQGQLLKVELEKKALLQLYTEQDRRVIAKQQEIDEVRGRLAAEQPYVVGRELKEPNPIRTTLDQILAGARAKLQALQARQVILAKQLATDASSLTQLTLTNFQHDKLTQAIKGAQENVTLYMKKAEEARISEAMDREKLVNVAIVERATTPVPVAGLQTLLMPLGAVAGLALGIGGVFVAEFFNPAFRNEGDIEQRLGLPVLASIDHFKS
jgi:uncharacterized protein involved in exopolysaccharide biosynthesis